MELLTAISVYRSHKLAKGVKHLKKTSDMLKKTIETLWCTHYNKIRGSGSVKRNMKKWWAERNGLSTRP